MFSANSSILPTGLKPSDVANRVRLGGTRSDLGRYRVGLGRNGVGQGENGVGLAGNEVSLEENGVGPRGERDRTGEGTGSDYGLDEGVGLEEDRIGGADGGSD